jgi:hypothetical protein
MSTLELVGRGVASPSLPDGIPYPALAGQSGELIGADLHGKYYTQNKRGQVFIGCTAVAGVAVPKYDATAQVFSLWNPATSTKCLELLKINMGLTALGTRVVSNYALTLKSGCGSEIATGAVYTAFTEVAPISGKYANGIASVAKFAPAAATATAAFSVYYNLPFGHDLAAGGSYPVMTYDFDGTLILPPGTACTLVSATSATGTTNSVNLMWAEFPV